MTMPFGLGQRRVSAAVAVGAGDSALPRRLRSRCTRSSCEHEVGWSCSYRDRRGAVCDTWWCQKHVDFVEGMPFCKRHASVIRSINKTRGTGREVKTMPEVSDRSASLVNIVADDLDIAVVELLQQRFRGRADVSIAADRTPRDIWVERKELAWSTLNSPYLKRVGTELAWERTWSALNSQGHVARIAVRFSASEPPTVQALVGNRPVAEGTPDWILRRLARERSDEHAADRAIFRD